MIRHDVFSTYEFKRFIDKNKIQIEDMMTLPSNREISRYIDKMMFDIKPNIYGIMSKNGVRTILSVEANIITYFLNDNVYYSSKKFTKGMPVSIAQDKTLQGIFETRELNLYCLGANYGTIQEIEEFFNFQYTTDEITEFLER